MKTITTWKKTWFPKLSSSGSRYLDEYLDMHLGSVPQEEKGRGQDWSKGEAELWCSLLGILSQLHGELSTCKGPPYCPDLKKECQAFLPLCCPDSAAGKSVGRSKVSFFRQGNSEVGQGTEVCFFSSHLGSWANKFFSPSLRRMWAVHHNIPDYCSKIHCLPIIIQCCVILSWTAVF